MVTINGSPCLLEIATSVACRAASSRRIRGFQWRNASYTRKMMAEPRPTWVAQLSEFLRIPSISADPAYIAAVRAAGEWICAFIRRAGGTCELVPTPRHPLVVGEIPASTRDPAPTVLLYGHFDVQPAGDEQLWESPPFAPTIRDGWLYARGAADDKGNLYLLLKAAESLAAEDALPVNVRIACDGEEEIVGTSIIEFLEADEHGADACLIFDGPMPEVDRPAFMLATRGLLYYHLRARSGERDLHSGLYGGVALNAVHGLIRALNAVVSMPDELRAGAVPPTDEEVAAWRQLRPGTAMLADQGAQPIDERAVDDFYLRVFAEPSIDVNGVRGGEADFQKTVLPVEAVANISMRLAPGQDVVEIGERFECLVRGAAPRFLDLEIEHRSVTPPGLISPDQPAVRLAQQAFERVLGKRPLLLRSGGTLPIVPALAEKGIPTVLTGFDVPEGNVHSPNERLLLRYLPLGVAAAREVLVAFAGLPRAAA
jgi:acetylornithine deacetylase/succinyl-diaminopimelate desuccinylase-like protein